ncbi:TPA: hypothetical protein ACPWIG_005199 [Pseudomonas aeruginosa]|uniref:hypothetical protein n=1 Tax=Pseudomonas aeruginosa TaxID=287 RepID=UPI000E33514C|nr:hypothetical protein [Pseudomonas aeruginosa]MDP2556083.1 hypothetical protein [Pseudomonas aeruginosa]QPN18009.1 hypothetical protein I5U70_32880 [Pseudomonas aeruginosa]SYY08111.1 Uncharacterised protein [Acinetobacter baumannii]HBN8448290.1 hypothetical protein [Pseudomonas aeruginosa]
MSQEFEARMRAIKELQKHLTDEERQALAAWEEKHLGDGLKGTSDWPGWTDVAIRRAAQESSQSVTKLANFFYFAACFLTVGFAGIAVLFGLLAALDVIEYRKGAAALIESNLEGASRIVFVLMFSHVVGKFIARRGLRRAQLPR